MSNQVEQIRAEVERQYINARGAADWSGKEITRGESLAFKQVLDFIDALLAKENPILVPESKETPIEVCGKKVMVRYTRDGQPCEKCVFGEKDSLCQRVRDECSRLDKVGMEIDERAYFVPAEEKRRKIRVKNMAKIKAGLQKNIDEAKEIEGTPQEVTLIPSNEGEDEAAEMAARRAYPYEGGTKGDICEASIPIFCKGFKAGIAYERERLMKEAVEGEVVGYDDGTGKFISLCEDLPDNTPYKVGEKVNVIIIKKEK